MLGTGIPSAIGAKLGAPEREVVCVTGDGAAGFNFMEMQSAAREGVKITVDRLRRGLVDDGGAQRALLYGRRSAPSWARCAGTSSRRDSAATANTSSASRTSTARCARPRGRRTGLVCLRTDRDANLAVPPR